MPTPGCRTGSCAPAPLPVDRMRPVGLRRWPGPCGALGAWPLPGCQESRALWPLSRPPAQGPAPRGPGPDPRDAPCGLARPPQLWWLLFEGLAPRPSSGSAPCLMPSVPERVGWCSSLHCGQRLAQLLTDSLVADGQAQPHKSLRLQSPLFAFRCGTRPVFL